MDGCGTASQGINASGIAEFVRVEIPDQLNARTGVLEFLYYLNRPNFSKNFVPRLKCSTPDCVNEMSRMTSGVKTLR
jgi:hypothetical protein